MLRTTLVSAAAALALAVPVVSAEAAPAPTARSADAILGHWKGKVYGDNGAPAGYAAKVHIYRKNGTLHGHVTYPDYCSGKWVYLGKWNGWRHFKEKITKDPGAATCVTPVKAKVKRKDAKLKVVWTEPKTGDQGHMLAHRI